MKGGGDTWALEDSMSSHNKRTDDDNIYDYTGREESDRQAA